ncbi:hypothetical protein C1646_750841 [Rhizophagus diaphanus]|nr:hypothetical protein C1646_750841 [Rhizophagus diaphanus] [Rhizophagus sp. MUCL 43196]
MEYNDSETSNTESSSFNSEYEENETSKKIAELKQEEFIRLLVAEKLYPLWPTTESLSEINKCIDKSRKPNGNSKRFKKKKVVESNDEINEKE